MRKTCWVRELVRYDPHIDKQRQMADLVPVYRLRQVEVDDAVVSEVPTDMLDDEQGNEYGDFTDDEVDGAHTV